MTGVQTCALPISFLGFRVSLFLPQTLANKKVQFGVGGINGKRGSVELAFHLEESGEIVGRGKKHMLLSGLREYDEDVVVSAIATYNRSKAVFAAR